MPEPLRLKRDAQLYALELQSISRLTLPLTLSMRLGAVQPGTFWELAEVVLLLAKTLDNSQSPLAHVGLLLHRCLHGCKAEPPDRQNLAERLHSIDLHLTTESSCCTANSFNFPYLFQLLRGSLDLVFQIIASISPIFSSDRD
jgi:hypothetical protein